MGLPVGLITLSFLLSGPTHAQLRIHCDGQTENLNTCLEIHKVLFTDRDTTRVEEFYADEAYISPTWIQVGQGGRVNALSRTLIQK